MKLATVLGAALAVMLAAGATAATTRHRPEAPRLIGALVAMLGCGGGYDAALVAVDLLDDLDDADAAEAMAEAAQ